MPDPIRETLTFVKMPGQGNWEVRTEAGAVITGVERVQCDLEHSQVRVLFDIDTATMTTTEVP